MSTVNLTGAEVDTALKVLETMAGVVAENRGEHNDIFEALELSYAFINSTKQHQQRMDATDADATEVIG